MWTVRRDEATAIGEIMPFKVLEMWTFVSTVNGYSLKVRQFAAL